MKKKMMQEKGKENVDQETDYCEYNMKNRRKSCEITVELIDPFQEKIMDKGEGCSSNFEPDIWKRMDAVRSKNKRAEESEGYVKDPYYERLNRYKENFNEKQSRSLRIVYAYEKDAMNQGLIKEMSHYNKFTGSMSPEDAILHEDEKDISKVIDGFLFIIFFSLCIFTSLRYAGLTPLNSVFISSCVLIFASVPLTLILVCIKWRTIIRGFGHLFSILLTSSSCVISNCLYCCLNSFVRSSTCSGYLPYDIFGLICCCGYCFNECKCMKYTDCSPSYMFNFKRKKNDFIFESGTEMINL